MPINIFPESFSQNKGLPIRIVSPEFGHISPQAAKKYGPAHRLPYYFFLFMLDGASRHIVDLDTVDVGKHELLFALPHQIRQLPVISQGADYYKLGFDDQCLSRLPRSYPFLLNPHNLKKISFTADTVIRLEAIFKMLLALLKNPDTQAELILAHLNCLMTEIDSTYWGTGKMQADGRLGKFIDFKVFIENNLVEHPSIKDIADALAVSMDNLYQIVRQYTDRSPKEYLTERLILEAKRRMYYGKRSSVKELAFELGFNDPDYFSRLFKKLTGKTVTGFFQDLS